MTGVRRIWSLFLMAFLCLPAVLSGQEEGSAELTTEVVQDAFQESFFEGLKEKSIGNLDKAVAFFARCKEMDPGQAVVNYELGRIFLEQRQYPQALDHLLLALEAEPSNIWFLKALVALYLEQEELEKSVLLAETYRDRGWEQQVLLADLYIENGDIEKAEVLLSNPDLSHALPVQVEALEARIQLIKTAEEEPFVAREDKSVGGREITESGSLNNLKSSLAALAGSGQFQLLLEKSTEAISNFPAQPEFYYFRGLAFLKTGEPEKVLEVSEEGLAYLLEDNELELAFYQLMKEAYEQMGNDKKRKEIEEKIRQ